MPESKPETSPPPPRNRPWLPWQNLILAATVMAVVGAVIEQWNLQTGWPLGRKAFTPHPMISEPVRLALLALVWPLSLLSARVAALWWLARARPGRAPGIRNLVLTATLALWPQCLADTVARGHLGWYTWVEPRWRLQGLVLDPLPGWWVGHLIALAAALPALLDKHPHPRLPPLRAFLLWVVWNGLLLLACAGHVEEATLALLLAPFAVVTVCAFHAGYPAATNRTRPTTAPPPNGAAPDRDPEGPSA